jgi:hypothetical protein
VFPKFSFYKGKGGGRGCRAERGRRRKKRSRRVLSSVIFTTTVYLNVLGK